MLLNKIIVTNYGENTISIIDKGNLSYINTIDLKAIIPARKGITRAILEDKQTLLVLDSDNDSLYRIDLNKRELLKQLNLGRCPFRIKSYKDRIFVTNLDSNSLSIIDKDEFSIIENIYLGEKPTDLAIDEDSGKLFITNLNSYSISIVDYENDEVAQIKLPYMPFRVKVDKNGFYILGFINNNTLNSSILAFFSKNNKERWKRVID
ncbi:MAG TPA: YncE family protein, partial [Tissierellaceae bacterium]|nr:YncE family protein [Tissierellaceae bacterium]